MPGMGSRRANFAGLLEIDQPKDTEVTIVEEGSTTANSSKKRKRQRTSGNHNTIQAHWVVLWSLSPYFQAKLERWSQDATPSKKPRKQKQQQQGRQQQQEQPPAPYQYSLQLLVPPGQLELGRRLITAMYSSSPDLSDLEAPQLMQLVTLAESYGVGKVVADAAKQLYKLSKDSMPLDLAASVFELPEACLELKAIKKVQQAAADKLQQELGDLEVLWGDEGKQQALLGLPFGALLQLLRDERTQVASEDTAVYTALWWLKRAGNCADLEYQQQQLGSVLRPQHCTVTFLARVAVGKTTGWVYANDRWVLEGLLAVAGKSKKKRREWGENEAPDDKAAWRLPPRPRSAVAPLELSWDLPLAEVEDSLAADPNKLVSLDSGARVSRQGRCWWLAFDYEPSTRLLGVFVCVADVPACITAAIWLDTAPGGRAGSVLKLDAAYMRDSLGGALARVGRGEEGWPAVKAWLQQHGLVHPDGCLHLRATITKVA